MNPATGYKGDQPPDFTQFMQTGSASFIPKRHAITKDYTILTKCLGVGVSGKVLMCIHKVTKEKRALKVYKA